MATALPAIPKLDSTLGAIEVGTLISCFLYGVSHEQSRTLPLAETN